MAPVDIAMYRRLRHAGLRETLRNLGGRVAGHERVLYLRFYDSPKAREVGAAASTLDATETASKILRSDLDECAGLKSV